MAERGGPGRRNRICRGTRCKRASHVRGKLSRDYLGEIGNNARKKLIKARDWGSFSKLL